MALLDNRINEMWGWTEEDRSKLIEKCLIIGAGTFQLLYAAKGRHLGFRDVAAEPGQAPIDLRSQSAIPVEILNRFNAMTLFVHPPGKEEIRARVLEIHSELGCAPPSAASLDLLLHKAVTSGQHTRWTESYFARLLEGHLPAEDQIQPHEPNATADIESASLYA